MKRRRKNIRNLSRTTSIRESYDHLLIVCEGTKTEPEYFRHLINKYKLSTVNIELKSSDKSDPKSIVKFAKKLNAQLKRQGAKYDRIYCVFDRDNHPNFSVLSHGPASSIGYCYIFISRENHSTYLEPRAHVTSVSRN